LNEPYANWEMEFQYYFYEGIIVISYHNYHKNTNEFNNKIYEYWEIKQKLKGKMNKKNLNMKKMTG